MDEDRINDLNNNQVENSPDESSSENHHYELNILAWVMVLIIAAAAVWFFVLRDNPQSASPDSGGDSALNEEVLAQRMEIAGGDLGEMPFAKIVGAFSLENFPIPSDSSESRISSIAVNPESPDRNLAILSYSSEDRISEAKETYLSWGEGRGYDVSERNTSVDGGVTLDIFNGDFRVVTVSISPSGRSETKVTLSFPTN